VAATGEGSCVIVADSLLLRARIKPEIEATSPKKTAHHVHTCAHFVAVFASESSSGHLLEAVFANPPNTIDRIEKSTHKTTVDARTQTAVAPMVVLSHVPRIVVVLQE